MIKKTIIQSVCGGNGLSILILIRACRLHIACIILQKYSYFFYFCMNMYINDIIILC